MEKKYYIDLYKAIKDRDYLFDTLFDFRRERQKNNVKLYISSSKDEVLFNGYYEKVQKVINYYVQGGISKNEMVVCLNINQYFPKEDGQQDTSYSFNSNQWQTIEKVKEKMDNIGVSFVFEDQTSSFTPNQVKCANDKIQITANDIKEKNLSPLESVFMAYKSVISKKYLEVDDISSNYGIARSPYGVLNSNNVVCVGYINWFKAILDELNLSDVKLYINDIAVIDEMKFGYHKNGVIYIKDEKYNLDGYYLIDPTWDSIKNDDLADDIRLNYFLVPLGDIPKIKRTLRKYDAQISSFTSDAIFEPNIVKDFTHNEGNGQLVSFSNDGFELTDEFIDDLLTRDSVLISKLIDEIKDKPGYFLYSTNELKNAKYHAKKNAYAKSFLEKYLLNSSKPISIDSMKKMIYVYIKKYKSTKKVENILIFNTVNSSERYKKGAKNAFCLNKDDERTCD